MAIREEALDERFAPPKGHESEFDDALDHDDDGHDDGDDDGSSPQLRDDEGAVAAGGDNDDDATDGEDHPDGKTDEEREAIRVRRREERRQKKELQRQREDRLRAELAARDQIINNLSQRLQTIETRGVSSDISAVDNELNQLANVYVGLKQQLEKGTENQDGRAVVDATEKMLQVRQRAEQLQQRKQMMVRSAQQSAVAAAQTPDPRLVSHANQWISQNSWYKVNGTDRDSRTVTALDNALTAEGWDAATPEYWEELTERVKAALPHRMNGGRAPSPRVEPETRRPSGGPPVAGSSRSTGSSGRSAGKDYTLSPERVEAMKELGIWNDPKRRADMIAEYKKYDKENGVSR